jgi:hypothetical protein
MTSYARATVAWFGDMLVTGSKLLLKSTSAAVRQANPMSPADVLAVLGLFLRDRNDGVYQMEDRAQIRSSQEGLYQVGARAVLPAGWRLTSAAYDSSASTGDEAVAHLAETVHRRIERALYVRDCIMARLQQPRARTTPVDLLYHLDAFLVQLVGSVDALARIVDIAAELNTPNREIGWGNSRWLAAVTAKEPGFKPALTTTPGPEAVLELLATLRNNIHGDILRPAEVDNTGPDRFQIVLPPDDRQKVRSLLR